MENANILNKNYVAKSFSHLCYSNLSPISYINQHSQYVKEPSHQFPIMETVHI